MDSENIALLVDAVRAGDIEAAKALLPVDPIVKRAREICGRHFGDPARFLRGDMDGAPMIGAVTEALRTTHSTVTAVTDDQMLAMARAACYFGVSQIAGSDRWVRWRSDQILEGKADKSDLVTDMVAALESALNA